MKKKIFYFVCFILMFILLITGGFQLYSYIRIKTAKIEVELVDNLQVEVFSKKRVSDFILSINGKILKNKKIDTTKIGKQELTFSYENDDDIQVSYTFQIEVVDTTAPLIWLNSEYQVEVDDDIQLESSILCGDNYDNRPTCKIEGEYDLHQVGSYPLVYKAEDQSGNQTVKNFTLKVEEKKRNSKEQLEKTEFSDIVKLHKTNTTKIGIDISKWQEDIDFSKVKDAGVEFVMIRVGTKDFETNKYILDPYFKRNIEEALKYHLEVGVYFYSYANSLKDAKKDALWVIKQIKNYNITLPVAFDWEDWFDYNRHHMSFYKLSMVGETFMSEIEKHGYQSMRYGSKNYLEKIWFDTKKETWLAHYTDKTSYEGKYKFWQLCQNGRVDGIAGDVDIDVMYFDKKN